MTPIALRSTLKMNNIPQEGISNLLHNNMPPTFLQHCKFNIHNNPLSLRNNLVMMLLFHLQAVLHHHLRQHQAIQTSPRKLHLMPDQLFQVKVSTKLIKDRQLRREIVALQDLVRRQEVQQIFIDKVLLISGGVIQ